MESKTSLTHPPDRRAIPAPIPLDADLLCGHCGQNLRGVASSQCPECGHRFDRGRLISDIIPWERRRSIGRFRAYWRTARLVTFRPGILWEQREGITLAAARSFRRWTVAILFLMILGPALYWRQQTHPSPATASFPFAQLIKNRTPPDPLDFAGNVCFFTVSCAALLASLFAITGIASWFFYHRRLSSAEQRRNVALSYYTCAPLAWLIPLMLLFGITIASINSLVLRDSHSGTEDHPVIPFILLAGLPPLAWWWNTIRILRRATASRRRAVAAAIFMPLLCMLSGIVIFGMLHLILNDAALLWFSLR